MVLLGKEYQFAPWWANAVYLLNGTSRWLVLALVVGLVLAFALRPDRLVAYLAIGLAAQIVFLVSSDVALGHYYYAAMPMFVALAGVGLGRLGWPRAAIGRRQAVLRIIAVCAVLALTIPPVVRVGSAVAQARPAGIALWTRSCGSTASRTGRSCSAGTTSWRFQPYFVAVGPGPPTSTTSPPWSRARTPASR